MYRTLEVFSPTPYFVYTPTREFHGYEEVDYTPLPNEEYTLENVDDSFSMIEGEGRSIIKYTPIADKDYIPNK